MSNPNRPLSPHLSIYRWPITMTLSILHRMSGVALSVGLIVLVLWLESAAIGNDAYDSFAAVMQSGFGRLLLAAFSFAFFFHMANGVRHLFWDAGRGFEIGQANTSAWLVVAFTIVATLGYWLAF
jgi:succinate dehydrogenase / fumarate reductase cytochrome b subunit